MTSELLIPETENIKTPETSSAVERIRASFIMAKRFPRDEIASLSKIKNACKRLGLAQIALYRYPKGGQNVTGPSIRMAEMLAQYWGNLDTGVREIEQRNGESLVEAYCHDWENNVRKTQVWTVKHEISTRSGKKVLTDPRDIYEKIANEGSRRLRACILAVIPSDIVEEAVGECAKTLSTGGKDRPLLDRVRNMVHAFGSLGVTREMIEVRLGHGIDSMSPEQLVEYIGIYTSLNDKLTKKSDWFSLEVSKEANINEILGIS